MLTATISSWRGDGRSCGAGQRPESRPRATHGTWTSISRASPPRTMKSGCPESWCLRARGTYRGVTPCVCRGATVEGPAQESEGGSLGSARGCCAAVVFQESTGHSSSTNNNHPPWGGGGVRWVQHACIQSRRRLFRLLSSPAHHWGALQPFQLSFLNLRKGRTNASGGRQCQP